MRILQTLSLTFVLTAVAGVVTPELCAECSRYDFDWSNIPASAKNAIAGAFLAWSGGTQRECEQMRQRVQAAMDQLRQKASEAQQRARLAQIDRLGAVSEADRARTQAAYDQAQKAAEQASAAAPPFLASPGICRCLLESNQGANDAVAPATIKPPDQPTVRTKEVTTKPAPAKSDSRATGSRAPSSVAVAPPRTNPKPQGPTPEEEASAAAARLAALEREQAYVDGRLAAHAAELRREEEQKAQVAAAGQTAARQQAAQALAEIVEPFGGAASKPFQKAEVVDPFATNVAKATPSTVAPARATMAADADFGTLDRAIVAKRFATPFLFKKDRDKGTFPAAVTNTLTSSLEQAGISDVTITRTASSIAEQATEMYNCSVQKRCGSECTDKGCIRYGKSGQKVLDVYTANRNLSADAVKAKMTEKLKDVVAEAHQLNPPQLTHIAVPGVTTLDIRGDDIPQAKRAEFINSIKARSDVVGFLCGKDDPGVYHIEIASNPQGMKKKMLCN